MANMKLMCTLTNNIRINEIILATIETHEMVYYITSTLVNTTLTVCWARPKYSEHVQVYLCTTNSHEMLKLYK